jgi:hypothetical protein
MGGLISRHYIHTFMPPVEDGRPQIAHLVMLGTPNMGSPCADVMNTAFEFLGKDVEAVRQLRQDVAAEFNRVNTNRKGVKFSVLAGDPLPVMCKQYVWNDGVVPVESAIWKIIDNARSKNVHTDLTGTSDFSSFVKPRLAIGPKGNHGPVAPELNQFPGSVGLNLVDTFTIGRGYGKSYGSEIQPWAKAVKLEPKQVVELEIEIESVQNLGITFLAQNLVEVELLDPSGSSAASSKAGSPEANVWFRSAFVDKDVARGTWKVRVKNTSEYETEAILTSWTNASRSGP